MARIDTVTGEMTGGTGSGRALTRAALAATCAATLGACGWSHDGVARDGGVGGLDAGTGGHDAGSDAGPGTADAGPDWFSCMFPPECTVRPASCCGQCGAATPADMIGVRRDRAGDYSGAICAGAGCPACFSPQSASLIATCETGAAGAGRCRALDVRTHRVSECATMSDCMLAVPQCCSCGTGDPQAVVAVARARAGELLTLVCDPRIDCAPCPDPTFPAGIVATCEAGHCVVAPLNAPTD